MIHRLSPPRRLGFLPLFAGLILLLAATGCGDDDTDVNGGDGTDADATYDLGIDSSGFDLPDGGDVTPDSGTEDASGIPSVELNFVCPSTYDIVDGWNEDFMVDGLARRFHISLPSDTETTPVAVIFQWHGYGDTAENFRNFFATDPDGDSEWPLMIVTPDDANLQPFGTDAGIDWDILESVNGDDNIDAAFFEAMMGCLDEQFNLADGRIYSLGFSAGAVVNNMLASRYPRELHTVLAISGTWLNNQDEIDALTFPMGMTFPIEWEPLQFQQDGAILMTHGGVDDTWGMTGTTIINFEEAAGLAVPYLTENGRTLLDCPHTRGHAPHPNISVNDILQFFKDHESGQESPYVGGFLPDFLSDACELQ